MSLAAKCICGNIGYFCDGSKGCFYTKKEEGITMSNEENEDAEFWTSQRTMLKLESRITELELEISKLQGSLTIAINSAKRRKERADKLEAENKDLRIAGQKLSGVITNINSETYYLPDHYYEWMRKVLSETDEILATEEQ